MSGAVGYIRTSTVEQANTNNSIPVQTSKFQNFCVNNHLSQLVPPFVDKQSARTANERPKFQEMLAYCRKHHKNISCVVVSDLSRFARNVADQGASIAELKRLGIKTVSVDEPMVDDTAAGKLAAGMLGVFNQYFSDSLSEKTKSRMQAAVKAGRFPWVAPLGYVNVKNGLSNLSVDPVRAPLIRKAFELIASGNYGPDEARRVVVTLGLHTKAGSGVPKQTFSRIIRNPLYCGYVVSGQLRAKGAHEPLISEQLFDTVQDMLNGKRSVPHKRQSEDFPLRGFVRCAACDKPLTAGWSRGRNQKYARYWCWTKGCGAVGIRRDELEEGFLWLLDFLQPTQELLDLLPEIAEAHWKVRREVTESERRQLNTHLADATTLHRKAVEAFLAGKLSQADFDAVKLSTEKDKEAIAVRLKALESEQSTMESLIEQARREVMDLCKTWKEAGLKQRQELQRVVFPEGLVYSMERAFFAPRNHSIMQDLEEIYSNWRTVGVPDGI